MGISLTITLSWAESLLSGMTNISKMWLKYHTLTSHVFQIQLPFSSCPLPCRQYTFCMLLSKDLSIDPFIFKEKLKSKKKWKNELFIINGNTLLGQKDEKHTVPLNIHIQFGLALGSPFHWGSLKIGLRWSQVAWNPSLLVGIYAPLMAKVVTS